MDAIQNDGLAAEDIDCVICSTRRLDPEHPIGLKRETMVSLMSFIAILLRSA